MAQFTFRNDSPELTDKFEEYKREVDGSLNTLTDTIKSIKESLDLDIKMHIAHEPSLIDLIENPSDELCNIAIESDPLSIRFIKDADYYLWVKTVDIDGRVLRDCPFDKFNKGQISTLCKVAVDNIGIALMYVPEEYRSDVLCLNAISHWSPNNLVLSIPTEFEYTDTWMQVWRTCIYSEPRNIVLLEENKEMYELLVNYAFKRDWHAIEYIKDEYITDDMLIEYIHNYHQEFWKKKGRIFVLSKNPSKLVKRVMHFKDWKMLK